MSKIIKWSFSPYNLEIWNKSETRILLVAVEPNGENPNNGEFDMGDWFRTANPANKFHGNKLFYNRCKIILNGIFDTEDNSVFNHFRFLDLKATAGTAKADKKDIINYVSSNSEEILEFFISKNEKFGLSPNLVVLLGSKAHDIFTAIIQPKIALSNRSLHCVCVPHPSHPNMSNDFFKIGCSEINNNLRLIHEKPKKWFFKNENNYGWK